MIVVCYLPFINLTRPNKFVSSMHIFIVLIPEINDLSSFSWCTGAALKLAVSCDNYLSVFLDGTQISNLPNYDNWGKADNIVIPDHTNLVAAKCTYIGGNKGLMKSWSDGAAPTSPWRCLNKLVTGWETFEFDDSSWSDEVVVAPKTGSWSVNGIPSSAYWVWADGAGSTAYCRLTCKSISFSTI